ncbi:hypothetical protein [Nocardioides convexus]|uniref:hypothetical protein n=1 Tax=Nocardioides convexus TaxID=2712224 RepID=UPI0024181F12|nr:hypothetical protein [Nocardioides convexus]
MSRLSSAPQPARPLGPADVGWGARVTWRQPRNACLWVFVAVTGYGIWYAASMVRTQGGAYGGPLAISAAIFACYAVLFWWFTTRIDRYSGQPLDLRVAAFLWGGFGATWTIAIHANTALIGIYGKARRQRLRGRLGRGPRRTVRRGEREGRRGPPAALHRPGGRPDGLRRLRPRRLHRPRLRGPRGRPLRLQQRAGGLRRRPGGVQPAHRGVAARHGLHLAHPLLRGLRRRRRLPRRDDRATAPGGPRPGALRDRDGPAPGVGQHAGDRRRQRDADVRPDGPLRRRRDRGGARRLPAHRRRGARRDADADDARGRGGPPDGRGARCARGSVEAATPVPPAGRRGRPAPACAPARGRARPGRRAWARHAARRSSASPSRGRSLHRLA